MTALTLWGWLALELALLVRDGVRGHGSTRLDQGIAVISYVKSLSQVGGRVLCEGT
jgi:hypothetical protein